MALDYQDPGLYDPVTGSFSPYPDYQNGNIDFGGGWSQTFQDVLRAGANTWMQTTLMQKSIEGQAYIEGQRLTQSQIQAQSLTGGIPLLFLIGGAVALYLLTKD